MPRRFEDKELWLIDPSKLQWEIKLVDRDGGVMTATATLSNISMRLAILRKFKRSEIAKKSDEKLAKSLRRVAVVQKWSFHNRK